MLVEGEVPTGFLSADSLVALSGGEGGQQIGSTGQTHAVLGAVLAVPAWTVFLALTSPLHAVQCSRTYLSCGIKQIQVLLQL